MPYPPGSPWNDPPTSAQLFALRKLWRSLNYDYTEKDIPDTKWLARDLIYQLLAQQRLKGKKFSGKEKAMNLKQWQTMNPEEQQKYFDSTEGDYVARGNLFSIPGISFEHVMTTAPLPQKSLEEQKWQELRHASDVDSGISFKSGKYNESEEKGISFEIHPGLDNPPEWYQKLVEIAKIDGEQAETLITQANTTIELAKKCELHPFLHSFIDLNDVREAVQAVLGQSGVLYAAGSKEKFILDSAFDEIIDVIVGNLEKCKK